MTDKIEMPILGFDEVIMREFQRLNKERLMFDEFVNACRTYARNTPSQAFFLKSKVEFIRQVFFAVNRLTEDSGWILKVLTKSSLIHYIKLSVRGKEIVETVTYTQPEGAVK